MPLGVDDAWWNDGFVAAVLVEHDRIEAVAEAFGAAVRWWPHDRRRAEWWARFPRVGAEHDAAHARFRAFVCREPDLTWSMCEPKASLASGDFESDDYLAPMYEDALAACRLQTPGGVEVREGPVRVAARLSRELQTRCVALWGCDEAPALGGACLFSAGDYVWTASIVHPDDIERGRRWHASPGKGAESDGFRESGHDGCFLFRPSAPSERLKQDLREFADAEFRAIGAGVHLGLTLPYAHPFDFPDPMAKFVDEFVVAVDEA